MCKILLIISKISIKVHIENSEYTYLTYKKVQNSLVIWIFLKGLYADTGD